MKRILLLPTLFLLPFCHGFAQEFEKAADYIAFIKKSHKEIYDEVASYIGKLENGSNPVVAESQRRAIVKKAPAIIVSIHGMPSYKGDKSLQDSLAAYMRRTYWLMEKEYPKIQRMQDSASKTYPAAVKFIATKKTALNDLIQDESTFYQSLNTFSKKYGVAVPASYDNEFEKFLYVKEVANHHSTLQLIYSKCSTQESLLDKAIRAKDKGEMETQSAVLAKYVKEGYAILDTIKGYKQDKSLIDATRSLLGFYQSEVEFKVPILLHLMTSAGTEHANVKVEDPDAIATYPNTQKDLDADRAAAIDKWKKASQAFLKKYLGE